MPAVACVAPSAQQVVVWHAGGLTNAFTSLEPLFTCQTGIQVEDHSAYSLDLLRQVTAGGQAADVVAPADYLDIDLFLKPAGYADFSIGFVETKMVMAYLQSDISAKNIAVADSTPFAPPTSIPEVVPDWYNVLLQSNVAIGGPHPYLDPGGYRAPMMFRLAQGYYNIPNLYDNLLDHFVVAPPVGAPTVVLGQSYDFQLLYETGAYASAKRNPDYRYVNLPDQINLGNSALNAAYRQAEVAVPDLWGTNLVAIPGHNVTFGITIMKTAKNQANAIAFVQFVLGSTGQNVLASYLFKLISPAKISRADYRALPIALRPYVVFDDPQSGSLPPHQ
jgi:molybdate/tungstate transport system substrate-binding protein